MVGLEGWGFGGAQVLSKYVQVTKGREEGLGWVAKKKFGGVSAANGVKEGGVGWEAKGAGDIGGERSIFEVGHGRDGGVDREGRDTWTGGCACGGISGGCGGGGGGMWRRYTFSLARLEPTTTGVGSPQA